MSTEPDGAGPGCRAGSVQADTRSMTNGTELWLFAPPGSEAQRIPTLVKLSHTTEQPDEQPDEQPSRARGRHIGGRSGRGAGVLTSRCVLLQVADIGRWEQAELPLARTGRLMLGPTASLRTAIVRAQIGL